MPGKATSKKNVHFGSLEGAKTLATLVSLVSLGQVSVFGDAAVKARLLLRFVVSDRALGNLRGCPFWPT